MELLLKGEGKEEAIKEVEEKNRKAREREMEVQRKKIQESMNPASPKEARSATPILVLDEMSA